MKSMNIFRDSCRLICTAIVLLGSSAVADMSADQILQSVRQMTVSQGERDVVGKIRKGRTQVPFSLSSRGGTIVFQYQENNVWQRFDLLIQARKAELIRVSNGNARVMPPSDYSKKIAGTDVAYEDLSLRFLYWKGGRLLSESSNSRIKGRDCHIIEVSNPAPNIGQFAWVRIWIDKENGTSWQIDGYDTKGQLKKRFSITSVQRLSDGSWFFKQMKLEIRDPNNPNRTIALNYLEMDDIPEK